MNRPAATATEAEIVQFARDWVRLAASQGFAVAANELDHEEGTEKWSDDLFKRTTEAPFGDDEEEATITDPDEFPALRVDVGRYNDGSGFWLAHDLAFNHKHSDFTAEFQFRKSGSSYQIFLHDIHVM